MAREQHEIENVYVLALVQALYGAVSPNLRAVHLADASESRVSLHFLLEAESADDREEIGDIVFEFEALLPRLIDTDVTTTVDPSFEALVALPGRGVYHRKEMKAVGA